MSAFYYEQTPVQAQYHKSIPNFSLPEDPADPSSIDWVECDKILSGPQGSSSTNHNYHANVPSPPQGIQSSNNSTTTSQHYFINPLIPSPESSESGHSSAPGGNSNSFSANVKVEDEIMNTLGMDDTEIKRKAQNRAAQRAFRERKEQRVRELELKLNEADEVVKKLTEENAKLTQENTVLRTENQVLRSSHRSDANGSNSNNGPRVPQQATFPSHQFYASLLEGHDDSSNASTPNSDAMQPSYIVYERRHGETMLGAGTVWQMLMEDPVMSAEDVDINFVVQYIKDKAVCDGYGPVYPLREVHEGIRLAKEAKTKEL